MEDGSSASRALAVLRADDSALRREGVALFIDHMFAQPLASLVDVDGLAALVADAATEDNARWILEKHFRPGWVRQRTRLGETGETVGDHLPIGVREDLVTEVGELRVPPLAWAQGAVDVALVRELVAPVLQETLLAFARRLPGLGGDESVLGGIAGRLARTAGKAASDVRKSMMGGVEKRLQALAADFSTQAFGELRGAFRARLESEEGQALVARMRKQAIEHLMQVPVSTLMEDIDALPRERFERLLPAVVGHNGVRAEVRDAIHAEVAAAVAAEGGRSVGALLEETGLRDAVAAFLSERGDALARDLVAQDAFADWWSRLHQA